MQGQPAAVRFLSIKEVAEQYDKSVAAVRSFLNKKYEDRIASTPEIQKEEMRKIKAKGGGGRKADRYKESFVREVMGGDSPAGQFGETERQIFGKTAKGALIRVSGGKAGDPLMGVLASRLAAFREYNQLVEEMTREGPELRIRCIVGTDFFNSQGVWFASLTSRKEANLEPPLILLVYPRGRAAKLRISAEGEDFADSQFGRDARSTFDFIKNKGRWMSVKWADEIPPSLLIWTKKCALVEPYEYGGRGSDSPGCIGRRAPVLVVPGGTKYHEALRDGFDYVYGEKGRDEKNRPYITIYTLEQLAGEFEPKEKAEPRARQR